MSEFQQYEFERLSEPKPGETDFAIVISTDEQSAIGCLLRHASGWKEGADAWSFPGAMRITQTDVQPCTNVGWWMYGSPTQLIGASYIHENMEK